MSAPSQGTSQGFPSALQSQNVQSSVQGGQPMQLVPSTGSQVPPGYSLVPSAGYSQTPQSGYGPVNTAPSYQRYPKPYEPRPPPQCYFCGAFGHLKPHCPLNPDRRPPTYGGYSRFRFQSQSAPVNNQMAIENAELKKRLDDFEAHKKEEELAKKEAEAAKLRAVENDMLAQKLAQIVGAGDGENHQNPLLPFLRVDPESPTAVMEMLRVLLRVPHRPTHNQVMTHLGACGWLVTAQDYKRTYEWIRKMEPSLPEYKSVGEAAEEMAKLISV
eukprot:98722_1